MPPKKKKTTKEYLIPRPLVSRSEPPEEYNTLEEEEEEEEGDKENDNFTPGLLPPPLGEPPDPSDPILVPYADFLRFSPVPDLPRKLLGKKEIKGQAWPSTAPEEICSRTPRIPVNPVNNVSLPGSVFSKLHRFTVACFGEPDMQADKPCTEETSQSDDENNEGTLRFSNLSSKVDFLIRVENVYKFETNILKDTARVFKSSKPRICGACATKAKAELLPDLRHKYMFTFNHTIHIHAPAGADFESKVRLCERTRMDDLAVKICPSGLTSRPEILRVLQANHFIRVSITAEPRSSAVMPRPLPPEFREPQHVVVDEDFFDKAEIQMEDREQADAARRPPSPSKTDPTHRPGRSEPG